MIRDLKPYAEYKESGLPWLGVVPIHWSVSRLRHVADLLVSNIDKHTKKGELPVRLCNYLEVYKNERITGSLRFMRATASKEEVRRFTLKIGDVVITKDSETWTDIGVPSLVEYDASDLVCGYHLVILRSFRHVLRGAFLLRALQSQGVASQFHIGAKGVTRFGLSHSEIKKVSIPLPPPTEQAAIVRFLDHANGRIERAVQAKKKLIVLLNEQKQSMIHRVVTRGLDLTVPFKFSGVSWLGDIPQHWEVIRCGSLFREVVDTGHPEARLLSIDRFKGVIPQDETGRKTRASKDRNAYKLVRPGQLAYNLMNAFMGALGFSAYHGIVSPAYAVAQPRREIEPLYFHNLLRSPFYLREYNRLSYGIMYERNRLYFERFKLVPALVPPPPEQHAIVRWIEDNTAELNTAIHGIAREISLCMNTGRDW